MNNMKKLFAVILAMAMLCAFAGIGAHAEEEDPRIAEVQGIIAEYNATHGGTGALSASHTPGKGTSLIWRITGEVTGATKGLALPYTSINWNATLTGETNGEAMLKGVSTIINSGEIKTNGLAIESHSVYVTQGSVSGSVAFRGYSIMMGGGTVVGDIRLAEDADFPDFSMSGGTFTGAVHCAKGSFSLSENAVANVTTLTANRANGSVYVSDKAQLHFIGDGPINVSGKMYISIRAKITGSGAKDLIKNATLEYNHAYYPLKRLFQGPIVQFILHLIFSGKIMRG